jgi:hypothetical protein
MERQTDLDLGKLVTHGKDVFLCHTGTDKSWVEALAERIESVRYKDRYLGVVFDKWDFGKGKNIVLEIERLIDKCRFIRLVVSRAMLAAEWPTMERTIAVWSDPSGTKGRVLTLLLENVDLPPSLRMRNWIDFRDPDRFEESFEELISVLKEEPVRRGRGGLVPSLPSAKLQYTPAPVVITSSSGADRINEQLVSNLLPVTELPTVVQTAKTSLRHKSEIQTYTKDTKKKEEPPFILREGCMFTFSDLHDIDNPLQQAIEINSLHDQPFAPWFKNDDRRRWAVEILNVCFRQYCWKRFLRFDSAGQRYFFSPRDGQPKRISWYLNGRRTREVTTPHFATRMNNEGQTEKYQLGWRHQAMRANFIHLPLGLFLSISLTYLLTKDDGKTPRGGTHVGPILSHWLNQERNGQILRSIRFWSLVLTRGNKEQLLIPTGNERIVVDLSPATGNMAFGIKGDALDYDRLVQAEYEDDLAVPELQTDAGPEQLFLFGPGED